jgi:hypothetical protein
MRALRLTALVSVLLFAAAAAAIAGPKPPLRKVAEFRTNSGVDQLRCMGSYKRAVALGLPLFSVKRMVDPYQASSDTLLPVSGGPQPTWLNFCLSLQSP